jgi:translation initiation factor 1
MSKGKIVWSSQGGDQRKQEENESDASVHEDQLTLKLRRLTAGKGRTVIEITGLPSNKQWCLELARDLKKKCGVGGTYKESTIEVHLNDILKVAQYLEARKITWKKIGG